LRKLSKSHCLFNAENKVLFEKVKSMGYTAVIRRFAVNEFIFRSGQ
jgi:hypothetical protein